MGGLIPVVSGEKAAEAVYAGASFCFRMDGRKVRGDSLWEGRTVKGRGGLFLALTWVVSIYGVLSMDEHCSKNLTY